MLLIVAHMFMTLRMTTQHFVLKPHCAPSTIQVLWASCSAVPATVNRVPRIKSRVLAVHWRGLLRPHVSLGLTILSSSSASADGSTRLRKHEPPCMLWWTNNGRKPNATSAVSTSSLSMRALESLLRCQKHQRHKTHILTDYPRMMPAWFLPLNKS